MVTVPAFHMAVFGVYPNRDLPDTLRESFTAASALTHLESIATQHALNEWDHTRRFDAASPEIETISREDAISAMEAVTQTASTAKARMELAYAMASRHNWIKPIMGLVVVGTPLVPSSIITDQEQMQARTSMAFKDYAEERTRGGYFLFSSQTVGEKPLSRFAHIRCVVKGQPMPLNESGDTVLYKSIDAPFIQLDMKHVTFSIDSIDTLRHFSSLAHLHHSPEMGYGPKTP